MIELYYAPTPNGMKARIMLEEVELPYSLRIVDMSKNEHLSDTYRAISASHKLPTISDPHGPGGKPITMIESGAIMKYLARKSNSDLWPLDERARAEVDQWFMFGQSSFGPMLTETGRFNTREPDLAPAAAKFFLKYGHELYSTIDLHLAGREYFGTKYSIADIAHLVWVARSHVQTINLADYPNVARWFEQVSERQAVQRGMAAD